MAAGFAVTAAGMLLLSGLDRRGTYAADVLPGMLVAGVGLGMVLVAVSVAVLTSAGEDDSGMLSGLTTTGHEVGGSLGVAILATIATGVLDGASGPAGAAMLADGIADAFLAAGLIAAGATAAALVILPSARTFLPRLALAPRVAVH
jgi:hypothetical protein